MPFDILHNTLVGLGGLVLIMLLIACRFPIALAMLVVGFAGTAYLGDLSAALSRLYADPYYLFASHYLASIPLFLLMGQFAFHGRLSGALFQLAKRLWGGRNLAVATIGASAVFGSICGSSLATVSTMSKIAMPEMRRLKFSQSFMAGVVAAGGTLGTLIPPSIVLILYAILTEQNLVKMFLAAIVPGLIAMLGYMLVSVLLVRFGQSMAAGAKPGSKGAAAPRALTRAEKNSTLAIVCIIFIVFGGIYGGVFTPTEGASIGCLLTAFVAWRSGRLSRRILSQVLQETAITTAMIYMILLGAAFFSSLLALSHLPQTTADWIVSGNFSPYLILLVILGIYLLLGCVMDTLAMLILTLPIFFPIIQALDFGLGPQETALWFGVLTLVTVEMGLITPPLGLNVFVIKSLNKDLPLRECYIGILPFLASDVVRIAVLIAFPALSLAVVSWLG